MWFSWVRSRSSRRARGRRPPTDHLRTGGAEDGQRQLRAAGGGGLRWRLAFTVPARAAETFAWALEPFADTICIFGIDDDRRSPDPPTWETDIWLADRCTVEIVSEEAPDRAAIVAAVAVTAAERGLPAPVVT